MDRLLGLLQTPWFALGKVDVSAMLLLGVLLALLVPWYLARLIERSLIGIGRHHPARNQATVYALGRIARYVVFSVGLLVGLNLLGIDLTALAVLGGAIGLGIGLGLQNVFSNFVAGIILLVEQTLKPGDFVELESGVRGRVIEIGMRYTLIRTNGAVDVIVPNSEFTSDRVTSWTHGGPYRRLEFALMVWIGPDAIFRPGSTLSKYLWALDDALRERGLEVPFPQRDLHLRSSELPDWPKRG